MHSTTGASSIIYRVLLSTTGFGNTHRRIYTEHTSLGIALDHQLPTSSSPSTSPPTGTPTTGSRWAPPHALRARRLRLRRRRGAVLGGRLSVGADERVAAASKALRGGGHVWGAGRVWRGACPEVGSLVGCGIAVSTVYIEFGRVVGSLQVHWRGIKTANNCRARGARRADRRMAGIHPKEQRPFHRPPPRRRSARRRHALAGAIVDQAGGQTTEAAVGCAAPVGHRWQQQPAQQNRPRGHRARRAQELEAGRRAVCPRERIGAPAAAASHMTAPSPPRGPTSVCLRVAPP